MTCNQCGAQAPAQAAFCPNCGAKLESAAGANQAAGAARLQGGVAQGTSRDVPEEELWSGAYSPKAMTSAFIGVGLLTVLGIIAVTLANAGTTGVIVVVIAALLLFAYLGLQLAYRRMSMHYRLTTHRLVLHKGILNKTDDRILLVDIDDITVQQGFVQRMFNLGTITLNTSDQTTKDESKGKGVLVMDGIENPRHVGDVIDEARRAERSRRGVYMMNA